MAITVESPGIASAKEEAAAILFGREQPTPPVISTATVTQPTRTATTEPKKPQFAAYRDPEPAPTPRPTVDTSALRPYQVFEEVTVTSEPKVVRPYIDSSDYLASAVAATSVATPAPEVAPVTITETVQAPQTVTVVQSALDTELEEDTQYIVKFKNSTIVAATILATIFLLLSVLFVVNIVNLVSVSAEVTALTQETVALEETLAEGQAQLEQARQDALANGGTSQHNPQYVVKAESSYTAPTSATVSKSFFDWLCHALSGLFS